MPSTKQVIAALASGVDPVTGELLPDDSVLQRPTVIRALYAALKAVEEAGPAPHVGPPNGWKPWSAGEDDQLRVEHSQAQSVTAIAKVHGRTRAAIEARLLKLGLIAAMSANGPWGSSLQTKK